MEKNVSLARFSGYKTGGPADYFAEAAGIEDIKLALAWAKERQLPYFILSGGTNVLFADEGFRGLVIKLGLKDFSFDDDRLRAGAGALMSDLVKTAADKELTGLEWAGGLPGTLGGAVRGNAGCFGSEMKDVVGKVKALDTTGRLKIFKNSACGFGYRHSKFKKEKLIIVEAVLNLKKDKSKEELIQEVQSHIDYRRERQPLEFPSCGSVFKNIPVSRAPAALAEQFKNVIKTDPFPVVPVAAVLDSLGLKGHTIGGAKISEKHPNFIVNFSSASSADILALISFVKNKVKRDFDLDLETEIELVV